MRAESDSVVLVTGASTGLGLALARRLLATNHRLLLTARPASMERFAGEGIAGSDRVWLRPLDVTHDDQRRRVIAEANERWDGVDVLINNAGVAYRCVVEHFTQRDDIQELKVNFVGPMALAQLVLPGMRGKRAGRIINISSVSGMMAMPTMALYSASKFALEGASEALWYEARPWNIRVSLVQPGFIRSEGFRRTRYTSHSARAMKNPEDPYHAHYREMDRFITRLMERAAATPEQVAARIVRLMRHPNPPLRVPVTLDAYIFRFLRRLVPRRIYHAILYASLPGVRAWGAPPEK
jgi:hypothetical protein